MATSNSTNVRLLTREERAAKRAEQQKEARKQPKREREENGEVEAAEVSDRALKKRKISEIEAENFSKVENGERREIKERKRRNSVSMNLESKEEQWIQKRQEKRERKEKKGEMERIKTARLTASTGDAPLTSTAEVEHDVNESGTDASRDAKNGSGNENGDEEGWEGWVAGVTYEVERIVAHRADTKGRVQYRIKWVGFDNRFNSWVDAENMAAPDKLEEYELRLKEQQGKSSDTYTAFLAKIDRRAQKRFASGQRVLSIVGANRCSGTLLLRVVWPSGNTTWAPASRVAAHQPQTLIEFYQSKLVTSQ